MLKPPHLIGRPKTNGFRVYFLAKAERVGHGTSPTSFLSKRGGRCQYALCWKPGAAVMVQVGHERKVSFDDSTASQARLSSDSDAMPIPVLSIDQMRQWEAATWASGRTEAEVIERVGKRVAQRALETTRSGDSILILAGKGHNGDDGRAALPHLHDRNATLVEITDPRAGINAFDQTILRRPALVIDCLFGIGLSRPLDADWVKLIESINRRQLPVLSVDVPSGLNADTGEVAGAAIRATVTLCVGAPKRGLLSKNSWDYVGRLEVADDVGLIACADIAGLKWILPQDLASFPPQRPVAAHKGTFGHAALIAGSLGYHGAGVLAARAAQRAHPGLVTLITQENIYLPAATQLQAVMVHPWRAGQKLPNGTTAVLFGPGLAAETLSPVFKNELRSFWNECPLPVIADASALDWLPQGAVPRNPLRVITPHPGEAARLLRITNDEVQSDRPTAVRELSKRYGNCFVALKGNQTLIGRNGSRDILVNSSGNPCLAQGGSGDVLAGYITGLLAQPALQEDPLRTISYAVWQHGATADRLSKTKPNWIIEELVLHIGEA